jgi:hypothetical protein
VIAVSAARRNWSLQYANWFNFVAHLYNLCFV